MTRTITTETADCISCYREELLIYLVQRFGSLDFAQRVLVETQRRLGDSDVLNYVPNPHIYLIGYALSVGLEFMQINAEQRAEPDSMHASSGIQRELANFKQKATIDSNSPYLWQ